MKGKSSKNRLKVNKHFHKIFALKQTKTEKIKTECQTKDTRIARFASKRKIKLIDDNE